jgi:hypothetical protein
MGMAVNNANNVLYVADRHVITRVNFNIANSQSLNASTTWKQLYDSFYKWAKEPGN